MANIRNNSSTDALGRALRNHPEDFKPLTKKEEQEMIQRHKEDPDTIRSLLVQHNLRLVFNLAKKYAPTSIDFDEMIGRGIMGLVHAAEKFDLDRNIKFVTYATPWVFKYLTKEYSDKDIEASRKGISLDAEIKVEDGSTTWANIINHYVDLNVKIPDSSLSVGEQLDRKELKDICSDLICHVQTSADFSAVEKEIFQRNLLDREPIRQISSDLNLEYSEAFSYRKDLIRRLRDYLKEKHGLTSTDFLD